MRDVARRFGLTHGSVHRHSKHLHRSTADGLDGRGAAATPDRLLADIHSLSARAERLLSRAEAGGDIRAATGALREMRATLESLGRLEAELADRRAARESREQIRESQVSLARLPADLRKGLEDAATWMVLHELSPRRETADDDPPDLQ